jgi:dihydroneopterin aldolase
LAKKTLEDRITLAGAKLYPRIGTTLEERARPQECQADLTVWGDFKTAAASDSLDHSIDYCKVLKVMQQTASRQEYCLLETLAHKIVLAVLSGFPVSRACIKLRKRPSSLQGEVDFVEVEMEEA